MGDDDLDGDDHRRPEASLKAYQIIAGGYSLGCK